jgi:hypothetical protein
MKNFIEPVNTITQLSTLDTASSKCRLIPIANPDLGGGASFVFPDLRVGVNFVHFVVNERHGGEDRVHIAPAAVGSSVALGHGDAALLLRLLLDVTARFHNVVNQSVIARFGGGHEEIAVGVLGDGPDRFAGV